MKKLMMLVFIFASIFTYHQSYASGNAIFPGNKSSKSIKTHAATKAHNNKVHNVRKNKRQQGHNYYKYANTRAYLRYMGKAING